MGWGLSHKECGKAAASWLVYCENCENCLPLPGAKPKRNRCKVVSGEFYSIAQHYCDHHPRTKWRKEQIEMLNKKRMG